MSDEEMREATRALYRAGAGRCRGDAGEMQGRCRGDLGEMRALYRAGVVAEVSGAAAVAAVLAGTSPLDLP